MSDLRSILNENVITNEDGGGREAKSDLRPILNENVIINEDGEGERPRVI